MRAYEAERSRLSFSAFSRKTSRVSVWMQRKRQHNTHKNPTVLVHVTAEHELSPFSRPRTRSWQYYTNLAAFPLFMTHMFLSYTMHSSLWWPPSCTAGVRRFAVRAETNGAQFTSLAGMLIWLTFVIPRNPGLHFFLGCMV